MIAKKELHSVFRTSFWMIVGTLLLGSTPYGEEQKTEPAKSDSAVPAANSENKENPDETLSLDELLKTDVPELTKENSAIKSLWDRLVEAIYKNQFEDADGYSASLINAKDVLTPMRLEYCLVYNEISKKADSGPEAMSATSLAIAQIDQKAERLEVENQSLLEERPLVYKKIEDRNKAKATSAILGSLIGAGLGAGLGAAAGGGDGAAIGAGAGAAAGAAGGYGVAAASTPEVRLQYIEKRLQEITSEKLAGETERRNLLAKLSGEEKQKERDKADARKDLRDRVVRLMEMFMTENEYQPAAALANAYLKLKGMDSVISLKSSEIYREQAKVSVITKVAKTIRRDVEKIFGSKNKGMKPWTALAELEKMVQMAKNKFHDPNQLKVLEKELYETTEKIQTAKSGAERQRNDCLSFGNQNAEAALKQLETYADTYPDDPEYQKTLLQIRKLQSEQAEKRVSKHMAAVEETIENDPEKAKTMLQGLLSKELPELEKAILDAKVSAAFRRIYDHEIQLVRADVDEAQSYLEKYTLETGSDRAMVDLSSLHDKFQDLQTRGSQNESQSASYGASLNGSSESANSQGGGFGIPFFGVSGFHAEGEKNDLGVSGFRREKRGQASAFDARLKNSDKGANDRLFSFTGRLLIGTENINRALSLLEGGLARAKKIQQDPNLDKVLGGRIEGLCRSIEVSLEQLKEFRQKEVEARRWTWIFIGVGLSLIAVLLILIIIVIKKKLSSTP
jgi:hypothetical protein